MKPIVSLLLSIIVGEHEGKVRGALILQDPHTGEPRFLAQAESTPELCTEIVTKLFMDAGKACKEAESLVLNFSLATQPPGQA